ncbi:MAG: lipoyl(octanoyl) transferase LipB [Sphaerochaetaceae bacterium]|nr:lipoyl(octanoyl) transferase LipB [Sphaerochaetaceae bacterium]
MVIHDMLPAGCHVMDGTDGDLVFIDCSVMEYREALALQERLHEHVLESDAPSLMLFVEHPPVITLGLNTQHNRLLYSQDILGSRGIDVVQIRRGGGSTAHNPGQLVIYPIVSLTSLHFRVAPFVHYLEQIGIDLLSLCSVAATRVPRYPGLWVGEKKIASVGVQLSHSVSMHGIAINIMNDLSLFDMMVPCGIDGVEMTSVKQEEGRVLAMDQLKKEGAAIAQRIITDFSRTRKEVFHG